jgi:UDP-N-acetylmuramyl-tripeptide synthetase
MNAPTVLTSPQQAAQWLRQRVSGALHTDSRKVKAGDGFIAWPGAATDGRQYIGNAISQGAKACIAEEEGASSYQFNSDSVALYPQLKADTGLIAAEYYGHPSQALQVVAVTGTNGKTSTAWWLAQALGANAMRSAVVGTLGVGEPQQLVPTGLTTPDPVLLQQHLRRWVDEGFKACVMEASSIGIVERRLDGTAIKLAVFTNFTQDHLDYHDSMQGYWHAKAELFDWPGLQAAVINVDDGQGAQLHALLSSRELDLWSIAIEKPARLQAYDLHYTATGQRFDVVEGQEIQTLNTQSIGRFNVSNLLGVVASLRALGIPLQQAVQSCTHLLQVPGRMECLGGDGAPLVVVDYSHTPDALDKALEALKPVAQARGGELYCVFGCGGNRDTRKRPIMGAIAERHAKHLVVTSDNPRDEDPQAIIEDILNGMSHAKDVLVQPDRALAIRDSVQQAQLQDVILVAGKGHEPYQEIAGVFHPFSDIEQVKLALALREQQA